MRIKYAVVICDPMIPFSFPNDKVSNPWQLMKKEAIEGYPIEKLAKYESLLHLTKIKTEIKFVLHFRLVAKEI